MNRKRCGSIHASDTSDTSQTIRSARTARTTSTRASHTSTIANVGSRYDGSTGIHNHVATLMAIITTSHRSPSGPLPAARPRTSATTITTASSAVPTTPKRSVGLTTALPTRPTMP